jgi:hypothetical protein
MAKKLLTSLYRNQPATPEGKYLVKRRDGTVMEHPSFVLVSRDPDGADVLRDYANRKEKRMLAGDPEITPEWIADIRRFADFWDRYRQEHGEGDPGMGPHREDDPATVEEMRKGLSA